MSGCNQLQDGVDCAAVAPDGDRDGEPDPGKVSWACWIIEACGEMRVALGELHPLCLHARHV